MNKVKCLILSFLTSFIQIANLANADSDLAWFMARDCRKIELENKGLKDFIDSIRNKTTNLLLKNNEAIKFANAIRVNPTGESMIAFIALVEKNISELSHDIPGWVGNDLAIARATSFILSNKELGLDTAGPEDFSAYQLGCNLKTLASAIILDVLQKENYLSTNYKFCEVYGGWHVALGVYIETSPFDTFSDPFIIDRFMSMPGEKSKTFDTLQDWKYYFRTDRGNKKMYNDLIPFFILANSTTSTEYDNYLESIVDASNYDKKLDTLRIMGYVEKLGFGASQDYVLFYFFLGKEPLLPEDVIDPIGLGAIKNKIAFFLNKYGYLSDKNSLLSKKNN